MSRVLNDPDQSMILPEIRDSLRRIADALERLADALAPTPEQRALLFEEFQFETSKRNSIEAQIQRAQALRRPSMTNAIAGPQTGRGVR